MRRGIYNPTDIIYMRFFQNKNVLRVARMNPIKGLVLALYPTKDSDEFSGEAFYEIDDNSPRRIIKKGELKDNVWLRLLKGEEHDNILKDYESVTHTDVSDNLGSYYFSKRGCPADWLRTRTFHIVDDKNEVDKRDVRLNQEGVIDL